MKRDLKELSETVRRAWKRGCYKNRNTSGKDNGMYGRKGPLSPVWKKSFSRNGKPPWNKGKPGLKGKKNPMWGRKGKKHPTYKYFLLHPDKRGGAKGKKGKLAPMWGRKGKLSPRYGKPQPKGSGRCKWYYPKNVLGKTIPCQGSWEFRFAKKCRELGILIKRDRSRFHFERGSWQKTYNPDFVLPKHLPGVHVEVKGWLDPDSKKKLQCCLEERIPVVLIMEEQLRQFEKTSKIVSADISKLII